MYSKCEGLSANTETAECGVAYYYCLITCLNCPNAYVGQTGRQLSTRVKEYKGAVRRQDENFLLALHGLMTGYAFNWDITSVIRKETVSKVYVNLTSAHPTVFTLIGMSTLLRPKHSPFFHVSIVL